MTTSAYLILQSFRKFLQAMGASEQKRSTTTEPREVSIMTDMLHASTLQNLRATVVANVFRVRKSTQENVNP
jgi:exoribonuclease R